MSYGNNYNRIAQIISDTLRKVSKVSEAAMQRPNGAASSQTRAAPWVQMIMVYRPERAKAFISTPRRRAAIVLDVSAKLRPHTFTHAGSMFLMARVRPLRLRLSLKSTSRLTSRLSSPHPSSPTGGSEGKSGLTKCQSALSDRSRPLLRRTDHRGLLLTLN